MGEGGCGYHRRCPGGEQRAADDEPPAADPVGAAGQTPPAGQVELLDDYLPYAIVFGCTKQWADVTAALADADRAPSWYQAGGPFSPGTLSSLSRSGYYFSSMHHFATNTSTWIASASQAASSGGSGSSGFSGGGFSGGGGGGGGGGSW